MQSMGHAWPLQLRVVVSAGQPLPPAVGAVTARVRFMKPMPHDLVQVE
jgi:hypothetical protein